MDAEYCRRNAYDGVEECCWRNRIIAHTSYNISIFKELKGSALGPHQYVNRKAGKANQCSFLPTRFSVDWQHSDTVVPSVEGCVVRIFFRKPGCVGSVQESLKPTYVTLSLLPSVTSGSLGFFLLAFIQFRHAWCI